MTAKGEAALAYAAGGWAVFPLHSITQGRCTCGRATCRDPGKHPMTANGCLDASSDESMVRAYWENFPDANVGVATGAPSGLFVVDIDCGPGKEGRDSFKALEERHGDFPDTLIARTGSGGFHAYFNHPGAGVRVPNSANALAKHIDVRGDGGYVVAAPSDHVSGGRYEWLLQAPVCDAPEWLAAAVTKAAKPRLVPAQAVEQTSTSVDLNEVKKRLKEYDDPHGVIKNFLAGRDPTHPRKGRGQGHNAAWTEVTWALAVATPEEVASEAVYPLVHKAFAAQLADSPEARTTLDQVYSLFERARPKVSADRQQREREGAALKMIFQGKRVVAESPGAILGEVKDELSELVYRTSADGGTSLRECPTNYGVLLRQDNTRWDLRFNKLTLQAELHAAPIGGHFPREISDQDVTSTMNWLAQEYSRVGICPTSEVAVRAQMLAVSAKKAYDPLEGYLRGLKWDGKKRLDSWLVDYLGAPTVDGDGADLTGYLSAVGRKFMISAASRGLMPGSKVDTVMTLEGVQGAKKTSALEVLGGVFYCGSAIDISTSAGRQKAAMMCSRYWIIELGEMTAFGRAALNEQKNFLTIREDRERLPYGRFMQTLARRCVLVGTTNLDDYLSDDTGNRRHWPVKVGAINLKALKEDRDQLWAEAVECLKDYDENTSEFTWWLSPDEKELFDHQTEAKRAPDETEDVAGVILEWAQRTQPKELYMGQIIEHALKGVVGDKSLTVQVGRAVKQLGWTRVRRRRDGLLRWVYQVPALSPPPNSTAREAIARRVASGASA